ncbi:MAG: hypothetical protein CVU39_04865 [Chloroflexi bacterium HGW-Chloroflexi-10]|nr:MAG: hypothetical protein CVU39_04865 [Chloroflexi bacterium HGW-Chloroflexi-10]
MESNDPSLLQTNTRKQNSKRFGVQWKKLGPPFWTIISLISLMINAILIVVLLSLGSQIFKIKSLVNDQLLTGLSENFAAMDEAHITTTIPIRDQSVRANFTIHIEEQTNVVLSQDVYISNASIYNLDAGQLQISQAKTNILLPAGTELPINLKLDVPVDQQIPVNLDVPVDIPLNTSDLHQPFSGLQEVVNPYIDLLEGLPDSWSEAICGPKAGKFCMWLLEGQ